MADIIVPAHPGQAVYKKTPRKGVAFTAASTTGSFTVKANGKVQYALIEIPNFTNAVTTTISILDENGITIMTKATLARNQNYMTVAADLWDKVMIGTYTVSLTLSGAAGGTGGTIYVTLFMN